MLANFKMLITTLLFLSLAGCAKLAYQTPKTVTPFKKTPTQEINAFKYETDRKQLANVIATDGQKERPKFLRKRIGGKVKSWIKYFSTRGKDRLERFAGYGQRYRKVVEQTFSKYGLPKELYYVGIIESGYQNHARSHAGAVGPWQFVKGTATRYGLKISRSIDERKNIYKSTEAAALYFQDLYNIFGTWELALAGYNAGEYGIIRRIRGANTREYYELSRNKKIPRETRNYVPKVLAVMEILRQPNKYGIVIKNASSLYNNVKSINIKYRTRLSTLSKNLNVPISVLKSLNPDIKARHIPQYRRTGIDVIVPKASHIDARTLAAIKAERPKKTSFKSSAKMTRIVHHVRRNETLYSISKRYNSSISEIKRLNGLRKNTIYYGQNLKVPTSGRKAKILKSYVVKKGDYLIKVAKRFKTSTKTLKRLNRLKRNTLFAGQKLKLPPRKVTHHVVKRGDYLATIAKQYKKSISQLRLYNNVNNIIYPGQKLIVSVTPF